MNKLKSTVGVSIFAFLLVLSFVMCVFKAPGEISESERRELAQLPNISLESVFSGEFMTDFEKYTTDQIPFRDFLRGIKADFSTNILLKSDNNGLFVANDHISKIEYPKNPEMLEYALEKFRFIYDNYLKNNNENIYFSIIPDKSIFLAEKSSYPAIDYDDFANEMKKGMEYAKFIDIKPLLTIDDYYRTDSHWKQECIVKVAQKLSEEMGTSITDNFTKHTLDIPFYGVYARQSTLKVKPDTISYLTNETIDNCIVQTYETGPAKDSVVYNFEKAEGNDPYDFFLSGSQPLITIRNKNATTDKELIIFRDSFGSSLSPLLTEGYKKITVVDLRYLQTTYLKGFITFEGQDILFIYSTTMINNSTAIR